MTTWPRTMAIFALCVATLGRPARTAGQVPDNDLVAAEQRYRAALAAYDAGVANRRVQELAFSETLDAYNAARRAGDSDRVEEAWRRAYARSSELQRLELRVGDLKAQLDTARAELIDALDTRLSEIQDRLGRNLGPEERRRLNAEARDVSFQYQQLEDQGSTVLSAAVVYYPMIDVDPRDGPTELLIKAQLAERRATEAEAQIAEIDRKIERVQTLQRVQRSRQDSRAALDRFGDTQVPVSAAGPERGRGQGALADTVGVALEDLPLDQQLEKLTRFREQLATVVAQLKLRAKELRERLPKTTGGGT